MLARSESIKAEALQKATGSLSSCLVQLPSFDAACGLPVYHLPLDIGHKSPALLEEVAA